jgi:hypothetical protein
MALLDFFLLFGPRFIYIIITLVGVAILWSVGRTIFAYIYLRLRGHSSSDAMYEIDKRYTR